MDETRKVSRNETKDELPSEVQAMSREIGLQEVPGTFVNNYLKKQVPKNFLCERDFTHYLLKVGKDSKRKFKRKINPAILKAKAKRELKVFDVKSADLKFNQFLPIHLLWKEYMESILENFQDEALVHQKLLRADYHGCYLVVAFACCTTQIGQAGIVVQETKNTFRLISPKDKLVTIPKHKSIFAFEFQGQLIKIYGTNFCYRPDERSKAKMKTKLLDRL